MDVAQFQYGTRTFTFIGFTTEGALDAMEGIVRQHRPESFNTDTDDAGLPAPVEAGDPTGEPVVPDPVRCPRCGEVTNHVPMGLHCRASR